MIKVKHVTRIDSLNTHGWWVRFSRCKIKKQKFFADLTYQSKDWAFFQAILWLDENLEKLNKKALKRKFNLSSQSNQFGWTARVKHKFDSTYDDKIGFVEVRWGYHDDIKTKYFSVHQLGLKTAMKKAKEYADRINQQRYEQLYESLSKN